MSGLTPADLDYLERYAREMTPGPRGCEAGEPAPGEHFYVTEPAFPGDAPDGHVIMSADRHGDAVVASFLTQERVLALVSMARQAPRWIPVEERLPEENVDVLALCSDRSAVVTSQVEASWSVMCIDRDSEQVGYTSLPSPLSVTHWMPLPAPPEVK